MNKIVIVNLSREEMWEFLGVEPADIERIDVSFSPSMNEWSIITELLDIDPELGS
jgi:hypothetical protein